MKASYSGVLSMSVLSTLFAHGPLRSRSGVGAASAIELSAIIFFFSFFFLFLFFLFFYLLSFLWSRES